MKDVANYGQVALLPLTPELKGMFVGWGMMIRNTQFMTFKVLEGPNAGTILQFTEHEVNWSL